MREPKCIATAASAKARVAAGTRPAMNRPPMEMLATNPRMIMLMHGGMVSAMIAELASTAAASFGSWRVRCTAGMTMPPTAATSASLDPDTPEKNAVAVMMIRFKPPRRRPNMRTSSSISRDDMPFASMSRPASTKKGMASSTKWSVPDSTCCEYTSIGRLGSARKNSSAQNASTNAIGTPITKLATNPAASSNAGGTMCSGTIAFHPHAASASTSAATNVPHTVRHGPASAAAAANSTISRLPATIGQT